MVYFKYSTWCLKIIIHHRTTSRVRSAFSKKLKNLQSKMLKTLIALSVVFGLIVADPLPKLATTATNDLDLPPAAAYLVDEQSSSAVDIRKEPTALIFDVISSVIGLKASALTVVVAVIEWLVANSIVIIFSLIATLGFCKLTDKCSFSHKYYDEYIPVAEIRSFVTPERLETAEKFLVSAVEKYAENRRNAKRSLKF